MADYVITKNKSSKNASTREELEKLDSSVRNIPCGKRKHITN